MRVSYCLCDRRCDKYIFRFETVSVSLFLYLHLQQIKTIERYMRRLEFHMSKVRACVMSKYLNSFSFVCKITFVADFSEDVHPDPLSLTFSLEINTSLLVGYKNGFSFIKNEHPGSISASLAI